jgi:cell division protein FtsW
MSRQSQTARIKIVPALRTLSDRIFQAQSKYFYRLLGVTVLIVAIGLVMVLSSSSIDSLVNSGNPFAVFVRQVGFAAFGFAVLALVSLISIERLYNISLPAFGFALIVQSLVVFTPLGVSIKGNRNWIRIGTSFTIQPSEFIKLTLILFIAGFMLRRKDEMFDFLRFSGPMMLVGFVALGLVFAGGDLGTDIVIAVILFGMILLSGAPLRHFQLPLLIGIPTLAIAASTGSRAARISAWINPGTDDSSPFTWQSLHGVWALAAGRWTGAGLGQSRLKWSWIPEVENDYIFAIIGEEGGLLGAISILALFLFLIFTTFRIVERTTDFFARMVAIGIMIWLSLQMVINIAVVLRLLPVLGVPLPLMSSGGSSLVAALIAVGILLSIERQNHALETGLPAARSQNRQAKKPVRVRR